MDTFSSNIVPVEVFMSVICGAYIARNPVPRVNMEYINRCHGLGAATQGRSQFNPLFLAQLQHHLWSGNAFATYMAPGSSANTWRYRITYNPAYVITGVNGETGQPCHAMNYIIHYDSFTIINAFPAI